MTTMNSGHPERAMASRLTRFQSRHPEIMIWSPTISTSGNWDAMGDGWTLTDTNPGRLLDRIAAIIGVDDKASEPAKPIV